MSEIDYSRASVALYDPVSVNQRTTRYSLHEIGFRDIFQLNTLSELRRIVQDDAPHLIIAETADHEAEVFRLVRAIRSGAANSAVSTPVQHAPTAPTAFRWHPLRATPTAAANAQPHGASAHQLRFGATPGLRQSATTAAALWRSWWGAAAAAAS